MKELEELVKNHKQEAVIGDGLREDIEKFLDPTLLWNKC